MFILGFITSFLAAIFIFVILTYFRAGIEKRIKIIETRIESAEPKPKGEIFLPEEEIDIERKKIIAKNKKAGRDTPISELL